MTELIKHSPQIISRRRFIIGSAAILASVACGESKKRQTLITPAVGFTNTPTPEPTATPEPTKTPEVVLPKYPEKYDFGENDKYFEDHGGFFTGVERSRAEEPVVKYTTGYNGVKKEWTVNQELFTGIEVDNPVDLHKALVISSRLE